MSLLSVTARQTNPCRTNLVITSDDQYEDRTLTNFDGLGFTYYPPYSIFHEKDGALWNVSTYEMPDIMLNRLAANKDDGRLGYMVKKIANLNWDQQAVDVYKQGKDLIDNIRLVKRMDMEIIIAIIKDFGLSLDDQYMAMMKDHQLQSLALYILLGYADNWGQMRTGKTPPTILYMYARVLKGDIQNVLVVCPNSIKHIWYKELAHFLPDMVQKVSTVIEGNKQKKTALWNQPAVFTICNYETLRADREIVMACYADRNFGLVLDECHNAKNASQQTSAVQNLVRERYPKALICLSGTPVANKPQDIVRPLLLTVPSLVGRTFDDFANIFCYVGGYTGDNITGYRRNSNGTALDELHNRMARVSVRALRADVDMDLGKQIESQELTMSTTQKKVHNDIMEVLRTELYNPSIGDWATIKVNSFLARLMKTQQVTAGFLIDNVSMPIWMADKDNPKLKWLDSFIEDYMPDEIDKLVIACKFRAVIQRLTNRYRNMGATCIYGDVKGEERVRQMERFQSSPTCHIMIVNAKTAEGLDLNPCTFMAFYTRDWQLKTNTQMEDRITGFNQIGEATIMPLVCQDSIDTNLEEVLAEKQKWCDAVMGEGEAAPKDLEGGLSITKDDLFKLVG